MEQNSIAKLQLLHPKIRNKAIDAYNEAVKVTPVGVHPYIDQTLRTFAESDALYAQGRTKPGEIVSNSKAGQSYHNYSLALDFHLQINGKDVWDQNNPNWKVVINIFKKYGFASGADWKTFKDYPHFEMTLGYNWRTLLDKWNKGDTFIDTNGVKYVNI